MIRPADYIHPEDEAALRNMQALPGFAAAMKLFMRYYDEQVTHGLNMANKIRLSETQLPHIYHKLPPICRKLTIEEPEFYLEMNPVPNAYAMGDTRTMISVTSGLLEYLDRGRGFLGDCPRMRTYSLPAHVILHTGTDAVPEYKQTGPAG